MTRSLETLDIEVLENILFFCNQNDLVALAQTCHALSTPAIKKLYRSIYVRRHPRLITDESFIDSWATEVAGVRNIFKRTDQNDYLIYLKLICLGESLKKYGQLVERVAIYDDIFTEEEGLEYLITFVDIVKGYCTNLKRFSCYDERIQKLPLPPTIENLVTSDLTELDKTTHPIKSLRVHMHRYTEQHDLPNLSKLSSVEELILEDDESASLRLLKIMSNAGVEKLKLKRLVFNHVHGLHDYNTVLRSLTIEFIDACIDLSQLEELEMGIGCQEAECDCLGQFLDDLAPKLTSLHSVSFHEKTFHRDHYLTEAWDVSIGRFLLNVKSKVKFVAVHHNPPIDGKLTNGLEGNALRRRRLYEKVLPDLKHLETFVSPTFLQSCACYEVLVSDLLWNGCECDFCNQFLPFYDKYLMDHAYFDSDETDFRDMISPRLFGLFGAEMTRRLQNKYDLDAFKIPPAATTWNFHGYKAITCFNDINECMFDQKLFAPLAVCVSHFMLSSIKLMAKCCPKLKKVALTGIFFTIDENREVKCLYDTPERIV